MAADQPPLVVDPRTPAGGAIGGHEDVGQALADGDGGRTDDPSQPPHRAVRSRDGEAIELTAESELVLRTLGEHMFNRYIEIKRQEWEDYRVQVSAWELERYLPVL